MIRILANSSLGLRGCRVSRPCRGLAAVFGLSAALLVLGQAESAEACSCAGSYRNELQVGAGRVPANAGAIVWWFARAAEQEPVAANVSPGKESALERLQSLVTLERRNGAQFQQVGTRIEPLGADSYLIRPQLAWSAGEHYRLRVDAGASYGDASKRVREEQFEVVLALEQLESALTLDQSAPQQGEVSLAARDGSCGARHDAVYVDVDFSAPAGREDWPRELLLYTTYVDGKRYSPFSSFCEQLEPGASSLSRTGNRVFATCDGAGLSEGVHSVRMEARLAGADVGFTTEEAHVELRCEEVAESPPAEDGCSVVLPGGRSHSAGGVAGLALAALTLSAAARSRWRAGERRPPAS